MPSQDRLQMISCAISEGVLFGGGLIDCLNPEEGWVITTQVPTSTLARFRSGEAPIVTSDALGLGADWGCWVLAYQVGAVQHRVFLPLVGLQVGQLIASLELRSVHLLMDSGAAERAVHALVPVSAELRASLQDHWHEFIDAHIASERLLATAAFLLAPRSLQPAEGLRPATEISVTVVVTEDMQLDEFASLDDSFKGLGARRRGRA